MLKLKNTVTPTLEQLEKTIERNSLFQLENKHLLDSQIWKTLYDFQKDAVRGIINRIKKYGGCILADSVGLGKTFEALAVIKNFERIGQRVLVLCPKKLKENWNQYRYTYKNNILEKDNFHYTVLSHTDLSRESGQAGDIDLSKFAWEGYDLIVIDESHNFRNSKKESKDSEGNKKFTRYGRLLEEVLKPGVRTKVLLLSATPVNNDLSDLKSQLNLI
ncbi:MAG: DEAD/DEAH box helicase, partial [Candidatus Moranbacteria bacterium]|nr:DEAD/DEAH box helicase [Candidatus Moranbacteria bacterium]